MQDYVSLNDVTVSDCDPVSRSDDENVISPPPPSPSPPPPPDDHVDVDVDVDVNTEKDLHYSNTRHSSCPVLYYWNLSWKLLFPPKFYRNLLLLAMASISRVSFFFLFRYLRLE